VTRNPVNQFNPGFGPAVDGAGDLDGDGFDDIVVGAPWEHADKRGEGRAYIYRGTADGLARRPAVREPSNARQANFAAVVVGAGDVNNDGAADLAVSAPEHPVELFQGRVYVYYRRS
jgi:hypothetical protein